VKHILFELRGCSSKLLDDPEFIVMALQIGASRAKSKLLGVNCHHFKPQGVTAIAMLAESHISIHTWPEKELAMCDIFTCGVDATPELAVEYLSKQFQSLDTTYTNHERV
tara:strand:+ start:123 stop:452 length:330 start_codon:yes stop_codon:yes gene_type:complete